MKKRQLRVLKVLFLQAFVCFSVPLFAQSNAADTLTWTWEVSTTVSTQTKSCILEFSDSLIVSWGDGVVETYPKAMSGVSITHVYAAVKDFECRASAPSITYFKADSKRLKALNPLLAPKLTYLSCSSNLLQNLNVSNNRLLESFYCSGNDLTELNLLACLALQTLTCSDNLLTTLDVSGLPSLKKLTCHTNALTSLKVSSNGALNYLSCTNCNLSTAVLDTLFQHLPQLASVSTSKNLLVLNNPGSTYCSISEAAKKNWTPDMATTSSVFYLPKTTCSIGEPVSLDFCLTNPISVVAFELDVQFPFDFKLDTLNSCLTNARKGQHNLTILKKDGVPNAYKFLAYSMKSSDLFLGSNGAILSIYGMMSDSLQETSVKIKSAVLVDAATNMTTVTMTDGLLIMQPAFMIGDANGDRCVDVTDIANLVAFISGRTPNGFNLLAADLDNNGVWNVADIAKMVLLINSKAGVQSVQQKKPQTYKLPLNEYHQAAVTRENSFYLRPSESLENGLELCLDNVEHILACQVDIQLAEGVSVDLDAVSNAQGRQNGHLLRVNLVGENKYRVLMYALKPDAKIQGNSGALAVLPLRLSESTREGAYPIFLEKSVLTGMNLSTIPSKEYDLITMIHKNNLVKKDIVLRTDGQSGLWIEGENMKHVAVSDLAGRIVFQQNNPDTEQMHLSLPSGLYLVTAATKTGSSVKQKVVVR